MSDMSKGFLNFHANPRPYHVRVLERLAFLAGTDVWDWEAGLPKPAASPAPAQLADRTHYQLAARAAMREMAFRICGTTVPADEVDDVCPEMIAHLEEIAKKLDHKDDVRGTIAWIRRTYL